MSKLSIDGSRRRLLRQAGGFGMYAGLAGMGCQAAHAAQADGGEAVEPIAPDLLSTTPDNQAATFRNADRLGGPVRAIRASPAAASSLSAGNGGLEPLQYTHGGHRKGLEDFIASQRIAGMLVLKSGAIAYEKYAMGNTQSSRWTSFSVAKSVTSMLVGAALEEGAISSLDDPVGRHVQALRGSAYGDSTVRQLLCMSSGVRWKEAYDAAGDSDIVRMGLARRSGKPGAVMELMRTRERAAPAGTVFNYSTGESYVLGAVVAAATGSTLSDYLSRRIWIPCGMQADGYWMLDAPDGLEMGGNNFSATLRDYARLGRFFMADGRTADKQVLPKGWRGESGRPQSAATGYGRLLPGYPLGYGYQWWCLPAGIAGAGSGAPTFSAIGIYGQYIYVNPDEDLVVVLWSAWRKAVDMAAEAEFFAVLDSVVTALR